MKHSLLLLAALFMVSACDRGAHIRIKAEEPDAGVPEECVPYAEAAFDDGVASVPVCTDEEVECPLCVPPEPPTVCAVPVDGEFVITATARAVKKAHKQCRPKEETWFKDGTFKFEKHGECTYEVNTTSNYGCTWDVKAQCKSGKTYHFKGDLDVVGGKEVFGGTLQIQNPYCKGGPCDVTYNVGITRWYYSEDPEADDE